MTLKLEIIPTLASTAIGTQLPTVALKPLGIKNPLIRLTI